MKKFKFNERLVCSPEIKKVSLEYLDRYCLGRRRLGSKRTLTRELMEMIVSNCIYYNNYNIAVSMGNAKNYISENGIARSPNIEIKLINFLVSVDFINLVKGKNYVDSAVAGVRSDLSKIRITKNAFDVITANLNTKTKQEVKESKMNFSATLRVPDGIKLKGESFRVINGFNKKYEISNKKRVFSHHIKRVMAPSYKDNKERIVFSRKNKSISFYIDDLMQEYFPELAEIKEKKVQPKQLKLTKAEQIKKTDFNIKKDTVITDEILDIFINGVYQNKKTQIDREKLSKLVLGKEIQAHLGSIFIFRGSAAKHNNKYVFDTPNFLSKILSNSDLEILFSKFRDDLLNRLTDVSNIGVSNVLNRMRFGVMQEELDFVEYTTKRLITKYKTDFTNLQERLSIKDNGYNEYIQPVQQLIDTMLKSKYECLLFRSLLAGIKKTSYETALCLDIVGMIDDKYPVVLAKEVLKIL